MSNVWNLEERCGRCKTPRRADDAQCRRCGQAFEASGVSRGRQPAAATLVLREAAGGQSWEVTDAPAEVGRERAAITLRDKSVSRQHARVTPDSAGGFLLEDLHSTNGTFINDQPVRGTAAIRDGDQVAFGDVVLAAEIRRPAGPVAVARGVTMLYHEAAVVVPTPSQASIDPTLHEEPVAPVAVINHAVGVRRAQPASPPLDFGREVLELAQAVDTIAARLHALELAWRDSQARQGD